MIKISSIVNFFPPVKLAIWEASLDKFVESIQSIPEVIIPMLCLFLRTDFYSVQISHSNNIFKYNKVVINTRKAMPNLSKNRTLITDEIKNMLFWVFFLLFKT